MEIKEFFYLLLVAVPWILFGTGCLMGSDKKKLHR